MTSSDSLNGSTITFRKQVREFASSCEHLLSDHLSGGVPLTEEEQQLITYYLVELQKLIRSAG